MSAASKIPVPVILLLLALMPAAGFFMAVVLPARTPPELKEAELQAAQATWKAQGIKNYDLAIEFVAINNVEKDTFEYLVQCRDGKVAKLLRDNVEIPSQEERDRWSVDRMFQDIQEDIEKRKSGTFNTAQGVRVLLIAEFDPELGYPKKYRKAAQGNPENYEYRVALSKR